MIHGGHQERNLRGGTECVPLIVSMGKAAELARKQLPDYEKKVRPLRGALEEGILNSNIRGFPFICPTLLATKRGRVCHRISTKRQNHGHRSNTAF